MSDPVGFLIVGLFAIGMAVAFWSADPHSPTSRALALFLGIMGATMLSNIVASPQEFEGVNADAWARFFSLAEIAVIASGLEWGLQVARTSVAATPGLEVDARAVRLGQGLAVFYGLMGIAFPRLRREVWTATPSADLLLRPAYYLFALPFVLAIVLPAVRFAVRMRAGVDRSELLRLTALLLAVPFWSSVFFLPWRWKPVGFAVGEVIFLIGAIRYHVAQGQRGEFLARFLSPEVARLVRERGLSSAMQRTRAEISVVACDLRGFTAFAETAAPEESMKLLEDYYAAVGEAVTQGGGSIKDFAGDGIVALVGAPVPHLDHARRAVSIALAIRDRGEAVLERWRKLGLELGLGVGVASGFVTVGTIASSGRLEYVAIGPAVNLAARLASRAADGKVLADARVAGLVGDALAPIRFERQETAELKGFARPVTVFAAVATAADLEQNEPP